MNKQTHAATGSTPPSKAQLDVTIEQVRRLVAKLKEKGIDADHDAAMDVS